MDKKNHAPPYKKSYEGQAYLYKAGTPQSFSSYPIMPALYIKTMYDEQVDLTQHISTLYEVLAPSAEVHKKVIRNCEPIILSFQN